MLMFLADTVPTRSRVPAVAGSRDRSLRGSEIVDQQLRDARRLVVMHPMRRVGQALDAIQVGYVVAVGLGQVFAEEPVALPPDDQRRRLDRLNRCLRLFRRG